VPLIEETGAALAEYVVRLSFLEIQIPVIEQNLFDPVALESLPIVGLDFKLPVPIQVVQMAPNGREALPSPVQNLHHDLRGSADRAGDEFDLRRGQPIAPSGPVTRIASDV
jgi:hypothetical protein